IVMEFVRGKTLSDLMHEHALTFSDALRIVEAVCAALSAAHEQGIVHRDIKPSNIMVTGRGEVKVLDFGLAKQLVEGGSPVGSEPEAQTLLATKTQSGVVVGTPLYLSPEQALGKGADRRSDLFALGAVLYECLTGRPAFGGGNVLEISAQVIHVDPEKPSVVNKEVTEDVDRVVMKALEKRAEDRYQSAEEFKADLRLARAGLGSDEGSLTLQLPAARGHAPSTAPQQGRHTAPHTLTDALSSITQTLRQPRLSLAFILVSLGLAGLLAWGAVNWLRAGPHKPSAEAQRMYQTGTSALRDGAYYQASKALEQAVKLDDRFALAHARLAEAWSELDYTDKAKDELLRANALVPEESALPRVDALYLEAIRSTVTRNFPRAIESYKRMAELTPSDAQVYVDLGRAYEKGEQVQKAIESYARATTIDPQYPTAYLRLGILYGRKQDLANATQSLSKAHDLYQTLGVIEGRTEVHFQRGYVLNSVGRLDEAGAEYQQALELARTTDNKYQQIKALLELSGTVAAKNDLARAEQYAQEAIRLAQAGGMETLTSRGLVDLGNVFFVRGEFAEAEKYFKQALDFARRYNARRNEARALLSLGSLRSQQGNAEQAIQYVEQALPFYREGGYNKEVMQCLTILGRASRRRGDMDQATQRFRELLRLSQTLGDRRQEAFSQDGIGTVLMRQERFSEALEHFDAELAINRELKTRLSEGYGQQGRAAALLRLGRFDEARQALAEARAVAEQPEGGSKDLLAAVRLLDAEALLYERRFADAKAKAEETVALAGTQYADAATEARRVLCLARARGGEGAGARQVCGEAADAIKGTGDLWLTTQAGLALAEAQLETDQAQSALPLALSQQEALARLGAQESEWRAWLVAARAARKLGDGGKAEEYASRAASLLAGLEQRWGSENFKSYSARPDVQHARRQLDEAAGKK
ncbi:MAG TPA: tetratricopeptide repeat protein, partial [Pyrinomonadaceae bacterium]